MSIASKADTTSYSRHGLSDVINHGSLLLRGHVGAKHATSLALDFAGHTCGGHDDVILDAPTLKIGEHFRPAYAIRASLTGQLCILAICKNNNTAKRPEKVWHDQDAADGVTWAALLLRLITAHRDLEMGLNGFGVDRQGPKHLCCRLKVKNWLGLLLHKLNGWHVFRNDEGWLLVLFRCRGGGRGEHT